MDKMKQEARKKLGYWRKMCVLFAILLATDCMSFLKPIDGGDNFTDFFRGFQMGAAVTFTLFAVYNAVRFVKILNDEGKLREWYIKEHDERTMAIWAKSGGTVIYTCAILMIGAAIVAGYFNMTVFITLLLCGAFLLFVKGGLNIYYCKTM